LGESRHSFIDIEIAHRLTIFINKYEGGDVEVKKKGGGVSIHAHDERASVGHVVA
jgi:hypothetical protein